VLRARNLPVILVVVNNHGGGIFKFLPPAKLEANVGSWWTTPHRWGFASAAQMFDLSYARAEGAANELTRLHAEALTRGGPALIEVVTDGIDNVAEHQRLQEAVRAALRSGP
jgi:2-succinyl-5-enolpyruvyl-6-hydroxy-3-cyclohexene-1-carboxylate synthase